VTTIQRQSGLWTLLLVLATGIAAAPLGSQELGIRPLAGATQAAAQDPSLWSFSLEAAGFGGTTGMAGRPCLTRAAYSISANFALGNEAWTYFALGLDGFALGESIPDPSLFLYRAYGGNSIYLETGPRFGLGGLGLRLFAKSRVEILGGAGIAATEDTGTTLVSLVPFLRFDARLHSPISSNWSWSVGLPAELQKHAAATTFIAGLSLAIVWTPQKETKK